jgi:hypothetical protein
LPVVTAALAIACVGISLIGLIFGSWYIQRKSDESGSKCLLVFTIIPVFISCMLSSCCSHKLNYILLVIFSCGVWSIMLTTNLYLSDSSIKAVRLEDFGFSFWINIGASGAYLYVFIIYLLALCK